MRTNAPLACAGFLLLEACSPNEVASCGPGLVCLLAGTGTASWNGDGLPAVESHLYLPSDVLLDPDGRPVIVDYNNYRIRRIEDDGTLRTLAGLGVHAYATAGASAAETAFENPISAMYATDGSLYVAAQHEGRVLAIRDDVVEVVAGTGVPGFGGDGGPATQAQLWDPTGLSMGGDGLYVSDSATNRVRRVRDGTIDTVVGTDALETSPEDPAPGTSVVLKAPQRISYDADGDRLLIADSGGNRIRALQLSTGEVSTIAGTGAAGYSGDGGPATQAELSAPQAAVAAPDGTIYVSDALNHVIRAIEPDGTISTVAGTGTPGTFDLGPVSPDEVRLNYPTGLHVNEGDLYFTSMLSHQVGVWRAP